MYHSSLTTNFSPSACLTSSCFLLMQLSQGKHMALFPVFLPLMDNLPNNAIASVCNYNYFQETATNSTHVLHAHPLNRTNPPNPPSSQPNPGIDPPLANSLKQPGIMNCLSITPISQSPGKLKQNMSIFTAQANQWGH